RYSINKDSNIELLDLKTGDVRALTRNPGPDVSPRFSPDGKRIVYLSIPRKGSHRDAFSVGLVNLGERPRPEIVFDQHGPKADDPPHPPPSFPLPDDCWDGEEHILYNAERGPLTDTIRLDLKTGKGERLRQVPERRARLRQLLPAGNLFLKERLLGESKVIEWSNGDNKR